MQSLAGTPTVVDETTAYYRDAMQALQDAEIPFLVGGSHALVHYTGVARHTKDFDIFLRRTDVPRVLDTLSAIGGRTEIKFPHWLAKAHRDDAVIDLIFSSGNGVAEVDEAWFHYAARGEVLGLQVLLCPAEEMIWQKAFIMERERFDGADVAHILLARAGELDWPRLVNRFGSNWRVLLAHLVLFPFIYPGEAARVPLPALHELTDRLLQEIEAPPASEAVVRGTLLSRAQYLPDIEQGYADGRLDPDVHMTPEDIALWTRAIDEEVPHDGKEKYRPHRRRR
jgi:hypothetical protein